MIFEAFLTCRPWQSKPGRGRKCLRHKWPFTLLLQTTDCALSCVVDVLIWSLIGGLACLFSFFCSRFIMRFSPKVENFLENWSRWVPRLKPVRKAGPEWPFFLQKENQTDPYTFPSDRNNIQVSFDLHELYRSSFSFVLSRLNLQPRRNWRSLASSEKRLQIGNPKKYKSVRVALSKKSLAPCRAFFKWGLFSSHVFRAFRSSCKSKSLCI